MLKKLSFLMMLLGICISPAVRAATIIWVSDNKTPAAGIPADQGWVDLLRAQGYTVDYTNSTVNTGYWNNIDADDAKLAALNAADLIIISRDLNSGSYTNNATELVRWNTDIKKPLLSLMAHMARSNGALDRWRWLSTTGQSDAQPTLQAVKLDHLIFNGVTLNASNQVSILTSNSSISNATNVGNGTLIATRADNNQVWIAEWQPGVEFYSGSGQTPGGRRMLFCAGGIAPDGRYNLTPDGERMFLNAVIYMLGEAASPGRASPLKPKDVQTDVQRDAVLSWTPGKYANKHDVYFGTVFADVNTASRTSQKGVLVSQGQDASTYDPVGLLAFGQTYYWRVDEVNAPPDSTIFRSKVWSFTTEPVGYVVRPIAATASSSQNTDMLPGKTIDGSGLNASDQHGTTDTTMWLSSVTGSQPTWIQYDFDKVYKLHQMWVWNANTALEGVFGLGAKDVTVEYSTDPNISWTPLAGASQFARATGTVTYASNTTVDFGGVAAKYVRITMKNNWGGLLPQYGLSEVRFFQIPVRAREPQPASAATNVAPDATLSWRAGREAVRHEVYFGTDPNAVRDATTPLKTMTETICALSSLAPEYGQTYYWKVNEVNDAASPTYWNGDVWSFSTPQYGTVDDFEAYNDNCNRIFFTWVDGYGHSGSVDCGVASSGGNGTGSAVGNMNPPFAEPTIRRSGSQSMPMAYDQTGGKTSSEAIRTFAVPQDWTVNGIKSLTLWFHGAAGNGGQLYVKIDGTKVAYEGDAADIMRAMWQPWNIDLSSVGGNLKGVGKLTIGIEGAGAKGTVYIDDIRLYPKAPEFITPVEPNNVGLVARYTFDGNARDSSGKGFDGTVNGAAAAYGSGVSGQAIVLNGTDNYVSVAGVGITGAASRTISGWAKASTITIPAWTNVFGFTGPATNNNHFDIEAIGGTSATATLGYYGLHRYGWERNIMRIDLEWHHLAATYDGTRVSWYGDGRLVSSAAVAPANVLTPGAVNMGKRQDNANFFPGSIDEVRIYNRALSAGEIAGLAGVTTQLQKTF